MIQRALEYLANLGQAAKTPRIISDNRLDQTHQFYVNHANGEKMEAVDIPPPPRHHAAASLAGFADLFQRYTAAGTSYPVFAAGGSVISIIDDADCQYRENTIALQMTQSDEFETLCALRNDRTLKPHAAFILHLRTELAGCVPADLIKQLSQIKQGTGSNADASVSQGKETFGRSAFAAVHPNAGEIPEDVDVMIQVYDQEIASTAHVICALVINPSEMTFGLIPKAGQLDKARNTADQAICQWLRESLGDEAEVIHGQP